VDKILGTLIVLCGAASAIIWRRRFAEAMERMTREMRPGNDGPDYTNVYRVGVVVFASVIALVTVYSAFR
jgi:hypothetical protein